MKGAESQSKGVERAPYNQPSRDNGKKKAGDPIVRGESENESKPWGHGQFANMPQEVRLQEYPKTPYKEMPQIDDTAGRLAGDTKQEEVGERRNLDRGMY